MKRLTTMAAAFQKALEKQGCTLQAKVARKHTVSMESNYALSYNTAMKLKRDGIID